MGRKYSYGEAHDIEAGQVFLCVFADTFMEHMGIDDIAAVFAVILGQPILPTRGKFAGATKGTSIASKYLSQAIKIKSPIGLPMITGSSLTSLRVAFTRNVGRWAGRAVPVVGWLYLAYDVSQITYKTLTRYNAFVAPEDRLW